MEELLTFQKYAARNRMSLHTVIKKTMNGELKTVVKEENGKEITYILSGEAAPSLSDDSPHNEEVDIDYKKEYDTLHKEYLILKTKYEKLLKTLSTQSTASHKVE